MKVGAGSFGEWEWSQLALLSGEESQEGRAGTADGSPTPSCHHWQHDLEQVPLYPHLEWLDCTLGLR